MNNVNILLQTVEAEQKRSSAEHATLTDRIKDLHAPRCPTKIESKMQLFQDEKILLNLVRLTFVTALRESCNVV